MNVKKVNKEKKSSILEHVTFSYIGVAEFLNGFHVFCATRSPFFFAGKVARLCGALQSQKRTVRNNKHPSSNDRHEAHAASKSGEHYVFFSAREDRRR